jgi:hypothetical protein
MADHEDIFIKILTVVGAGAPRASRPQRLFAIVARAQQMVR